MADESDSVSYRDGQAFIEGSREIPLIQVFDHYEVRKKDAENVAQTLGLEESDVRKGISYWRSRPQVYDRLEDKIEDYSSRDAIRPTVELVRGKGSDFDRIDSVDSSENIFEEFLEGREGLSQDDIVFSVPYLEGSGSGVEWERNGSELGVYASGYDEGFSITYSVDGEPGPVLEVDEQALEDRLDEMYRNAVFESMN